MAAIAIVGIGAVILYLIAKAEGVDVGEQVSSLGSDLSAAVSSATGDVLGSDDPISIAMPLVKRFETFSARRYPDPPGSGKYSIAWGHSIKPGEAYDENSVVGTDEGDQLLATDLGTAYACVQNNVSVDLTPNQAAALISFTYNEGCGAFEGSTMLTLINQGDTEGAAAEFSKWIYEHVNGVLTKSDDLEARRSVEQGLFNS